MGSFLIFWVCIGPIIKKTYFDKENLRQDEIEDTFAVMVKNVNDRKNASDARKHSLKIEKGEIDKNQVFGERKITFEDYEAFMEKLERDGKLAEIMKMNPRVQHIKTNNYVSADEIKRDLKDQL